MDYRQRMMEKHLAKLAKEGHTCISVMESYPVQIGWCQSTPCKNASIESPKNPTGK